MLAQRLQLPLRLQPVGDVGGQPGAHRPVGFDADQGGRRVVQIPDHALGRKLKHGRVAVLHRFVQQGRKASDVVEGRQQQPGQRVQRDRHAVRISWVSKTLKCKWFSWLQIHPASLLVMGFILTNFLL